MRATPTRHKRNERCAAEGNAEDMGTTCGTGLLRDSAVEEFRRLKGSATGQALVEAMQASPHRGIEIAPRRGAMPVRDVSL